MTLLDQLKNENLLELNLKALIAVLRKDLGLDRITLQMTDEAKQMISSLVKNDLGTDRESVPRPLKPPYGHIIVSALAPDKERIPVKNVRRHGLRVGTQGATRRTVNKAYLFPVTVSIELHYFNQTEQEAFLTSQVLGILSVSSAFNFRVRYGNFKYDNRIATLEDIMIPTSEVNSPSGSIYDTSVNLMFETYMGVIQEVYAVNSERPITQGIAVTTGQGEFVMRDGVGVSESP